MHMTISLDHVQRLADQLSPLDQVRLIEHLSRQIAPALAQLRDELAVLPPDRLAREQLPVLTGGTWADDLPLSRKNLYGNDERC